MRKNKLLICLIVLACAAKGQVNFDWFPFHPNTQYNFKIDTATSSISTVIKLTALQVAPLLTIILIK